MTRNLKYIAIIPARSGSERIKDKNLLKHKGIPLIAHAIKTAVSCKIFSRVILSTDSKKYYQIGRNFGADQSSLRPKKISQSDSPDFEHIDFQIKSLEKQNLFYDVFVILRPTNPFRTKSTILRGIKEFELISNKVDSLRAIKPVSEHPFKMWIKNNQTMNPLFPLKDKNGYDCHSTQKKSLPKIFVQSAMLEISWVRNLKKKSISGDVLYPFESNEKESFDINDPKDLVIYNYYKRNKFII